MGSQASTEPSLPQNLSTVLRVGLGGVHPSAVQLRFRESASNEPNQLRIEGSLSSFMFNFCKRPPTPGIRGWHRDWTSGPPPVGCRELETPSPSTPSLQPGSKMRARRAATGRRNPMDMIRQRGARLVGSVSTEHISPVVTGAECPRYPGRPCCNAAITPTGSSGLSGRKAA